jgi:hypothetical protein
MRRGDDDRRAKDAQLDRRAQDDVLDRVAQTAEPHPARGKSKVPGRAAGAYVARRLQHMISAP